MITLEAIIVVLLIIECYILHIHATDHADLMKIIAHHMVELKKAVKEK